MSTQSDSYDAQMAAWKAKHGITSGVADEVDHEALMVAEDAKGRTREVASPGFARFESAPPKE